MVKWSVASSRRTLISLVPLLVSLGAIAGGCGGGSGNSTILCAMQEHCTPHGLVCDEQRGICVAGGSAGANSGGQANGGSAGKVGAGGSVSSGGEVGSGGTAGGEDGSGGMTGGAGGSGGAEGGSGNSGASGDGGVSGSGDGGSGGSAGTAGSSGNGGAGGSAGTVGSSGSAGNGGTGGVSGTGGVGGSAGAGGYGPLVGYHEDESASENPQMTLEIRNLGPTIPATNVVLRYYFSNEPMGNNWNVQCSYSDFMNPYAPLSMYCAGTMLANPSPKAGADHIMQITVALPQSWSTNQLLTVSFYTLPELYTGLSQANDYSYADHAEMTEWDRFTVTVGGTLLWGLPP